MIFPMSCADVSEMTPEKEKAVVMDWLRTASPAERCQVHP